MEANLWSDEQKSHRAKQSNIHIDNSKRKHIHQLPDISAQTIMKTKQQMGSKSDIQGKIQSEIQKIQSKIEGNI